MIPGSDLLDLLCFLYHFFMGKFLFPKLQKGCSVFQDIFHNIGQLVGTTFIFGTKFVMYYFPVLSISAIIMGCITGATLTVVIPALKRFR